GSGALPRTTVSCGGGGGRCSWAGPVGRSASAGRRSARAVARSPTVASSSASIARSCGRPPTTAVSSSLTSRRLVPLRRQVRQQGLGLGLVRRPGQGQVQLLRRGGHRSRPVVTEEPQQVAPQRLGLRHQAEPETQRLLGAGAVAAGEELPGRPAGHRGDEDPRLAGGLVEGEPGVAPGGDAGEGPAAAERQRPEQDLGLVLVVRGGGDQLVPVDVDPGAEAPAALVVLVQHGVAGGVLAQPPLRGGQGGVDDVVLDTPGPQSEEHTSELQSRENLVCRLLLEKKKKNLTEKKRTIKSDTRKKKTNLKIHTHTCPCDCKS